MAILPDESLLLLASFALVFTQPTDQRFQVLLGTAILTTGRRMVADLLHTAGWLAPGPVSNDRHIFSRARWSTMRLACALARILLTLLPEDTAIVLAGDHTVTAHPGPQVYALARHRDPVRSSHAFAAWRG